MPLVESVSRLPFGELVNDLTDDILGKLRVDARDSVMQPAVEDQVIPPPPFAREVDGSGWPASRRQLNAVDIFPPIPKLLKDIRLPLCLRRVTWENWVIAVCHRSSRGAPPGSALILHVVTYGEQSDGGRDQSFSIPDPQVAGQELRQQRVAKRSKIIVFL